MPTFNFTISSAGLAKIQEAADYRDSLTGDSTTAKQHVIAAIKEWVGVELKQKERHNRLQAERAAQEAAEADVDLA